MVGRIKKGQVVRFSHISDFTGELLELEGEVVEFGSEIRRRWPDEMAECPDDMLLIRTKDVFGNIQFHATDRSEIIEKEGE